ncbi:MAG: site-specific integrase [Oscillospiraceae bacterium]|nr:site-specific integrase [Oscillospiraceae bacterium]
MQDAEISRLLAAASGERYKIGLILLLFCGFRLGELLALRHSSLQEEDGINYLRVEHSLNRVSNFDAKSGDPKTVLRLGEPKSATSKRDVPLLPEVYEALREHMVRQQQEAAASWGLYEGDPFLISNELGRFIDPTTFRNWFNMVCVKAGIRHIRVHDCRHTAATLMLKSGASPHEVSLILGHSSSQVTERFYLHPDIGVRVEAIQTLTGTAEKLLSK